MRSNWKRSASILFLTLIFLVLVFCLLDVTQASVQPEKVVAHSTSPRILQLKKSPTRQGTRSFSELEADPEPLVGKELYIFYIYEIHKLYYPNLDPALVQAVMQTESNYIPTVQSRCGAVGLMQVLPKYHAWRMTKYGLTDIWDPYTNIIVGMDFLNECYVKYGSYYQALLAYNNSDRYARSVLALAEQIRQGGDRDGTTSGNNSRSQGESVD